MRLSHCLVAGVIAVIPGATAQAQLRSGRPTQPVVNLPRLMVANPYSFSSSDSGAAVRIGAGLRDRVERISDRWYKIITRVQMNEALQQYAYPIDAMLPPLVARQLATSLTARAMVIATLLKGEGGRYTVEARLTNLSDDAGQMVKITQTPNQALEDFGAKLGDSLNAAFKALPDAKECQNKRQTDPAKATEAALKALKSQPNDGLAEYCLAQIAMAKKAPVDTIIAHLKSAAQGDRLSLNVWSDLGVQYQAKGDSSRTIEIFKEMLRVAPTNEALQKEAFRLFLNYGHPEAAEQVARVSLENDPTNTDLLDLLFRACIYEGQTDPEKNKCAVNALEQVYALDSTKADTAFFTKITYGASLPNNDNATFLKWAQIGVTKFPNHGGLLGQLAQAYSQAGPVDSAVSVTKRLMAVDSSDVTPVLRIVKSLSEGKRGRDAMALSPYIERLGSADDKANLAALLSRGALPLLQPPADFPTAADMARVALKLIPANPSNQSYQFANYILGMATFFQMVPLDKDAMDQKSCPISQQMKALLDEAGPALTIGKPINDAAVTRILEGVTGFGPHINSLIKAYCK